jgi:hypothetical protein
VVKSFRNGKGELLVAVWRQTVPDDACKPAAVTLSLPGLGGVKIIDTLYGYTQQADVKLVEGGTEIPGLLVGDWPLILRLEAAR